MNKTRVAAALGVVALLGSTTVRAAPFTANNPFGGVIGTGTRTQNSTSTNAEGWYDKEAYGGSVYRPNDGGGMYWKELYATPQSITSVLIESVGRPAGGKVYVSTTLGGEPTTLAGTFPLAAATASQMDLSTTEGIYGIKVDVDAGTDYYQINQIEFISGTDPVNLALGQTTVTSGTTGGSLTDGFVADTYGPGGHGWRSNTAAAENYVGTEFTDGQAQAVSAIRIFSSSYHGSTWDWRNFDLNIKQGGVWSGSMFRANFPANQNYFWVDFGEPLLIQGVRLYGSTDATAYGAGGNNGDWIVDEIQAFVISIPEPATLGLLALSTLAGLAHRSRRRV